MQTDRGFGVEWDIKSFITQTPQSLDLAPHLLHWKLVRPQSDSTASYSRFQELRRSCDHAKQISMCIFPLRVQQFGSINLLHNLGGKYATITWCRECLFIRAPSTLEIVSYCLNLWLCVIESEQTDAPASSSFFEVSGAKCRNKDSWVLFLIYSCSLRYTEDQICKPMLNNSRSAFKKLKIKLISCFYVPP